MNSVLVNGFLDRLVTWGFPALVEAGVKCTCLLVLVFGALRILRRRGSAFTHLVWVGTFGILLVMPAVTVSLPAWRILPEWVGLTQANSSLLSFAAIQNGAEGMSLAAPKSQFSQAYGAELSSADPAPAIRNGTLEEPSEVPTPRPVVSDADRQVQGNSNPEPGAHNQTLWSNATTRRRVLFVWLFGVVLSACRLALGIRHLSRIARSVRFASDGAVRMGFERLKQELGLKRPVWLLLGDQNSMPMAWGIWNSRVLVPRCIASWPESQRHAVLIHELGHLQRWDPLAQWIIEIGKAVYWFHPLVWLAAGRVQVERERACDDLVLNHGISAADYSRHLLAVIAGNHPRKFALGNSMAASRSVEGRIRALFDDQRKRHPVTTRFLVSAVVVGIAVCLPLATMRAQDPRSTAQSSANPANQKKLGTDAGPPPSQASVAEPQNPAQRVRELIYLLRQMRIFSRSDEWGEAIRELVEIGKPAVPELIAELDRTERNETLRALGFTLRAIDDPRAIPGLIRTIPKTCKKGGSDCSLTFSDPQLHAFMKAHENFKSKDNWVGFGRPVNEILEALEQIAKHREGYAGANDDPLRLRNKPDPYLERQKLWEGWWSEHKQEFVTTAELKSVELPERKEDLVEIAGVAKFGPLFPMREKAKLGPIQFVSLDSDVYRNGKSRIDFDTGRLYELYEGGIEYRSGNVSDEQKRQMRRWPQDHGIDAYYNAMIQGNDLLAWQIDNSRWETLEQEIRGSEPLTLGPEAKSFLGEVDQNYADFKPGEPGTFLFMTREGGRGIVQVFGADGWLKRRRLRYRMFLTGGSAEPSPQSKKVPAAKRTPFGDPVTVKLAAPARDAAFLLDLDTGRTTAPLASLDLKDNQKSLSVGQNEAFAEWCRNAGIELTTCVVAIGFEASTVRNDGPPPRDKSLGLTGIDLISARVLPLATRELSVEEAREILNRSSDPNTPFQSMYPLPREELTELVTFVLRTRDLTVGVLEIVETDKVLRSITIRYRFRRQE